MKKQLRTHILALPLFTACMAVVAAGSAHAQTAAAPAAPAAPPASWASTIMLNAQIEAGITANPSTPKEDWGQSFTDKPDTPLLNQTLLTVSRAVDPKAGWDVGFRLQLNYGSDSRYTHFLAEPLNKVTSDRYQLDVMEASVEVHMPIITDGGLDLKVGQYPTPIGYETIDPSTNPFYSHSYIFNYGIPLKHTGAYATLHVNDTVDLWGGVDTGVNTSFGDGDENGSAGGLFGIGLNGIANGKVTILALSHIGPENPTIAIGPSANSSMRYLNDAVITYKPTDALTLVTELNYIRDDFFKANGGGVAQYASYALSDTVTLNGRAEVWVDGKNFFTGTFPGNTDFVNFQLGLPNTSLATPGSSTTVGALTAGITFKPAVPGPLAGLMIRPEIRYDRSFSGNKPFNDGKDNGALTFASDVIVQF